MLLGARQFFERRGAPTPTPLPYDAEVEWVGIAGGQAVGLDFYPTVDTVFQTRASFESSSGNLHFGFKVSEYENYRIFLSGSTLYFDLGNYYGQGGRCIISDYPYHTAKDMEFGNNYVKVDGVEAVSKTTSTTTLVQSDFLLGGGGASKVYSVKITTGGVVIRDVIPVRKEENGVSVGYFYDKISGRMFGLSSGSGSLSVGRDVNPISARSYVKDGLVAMWDGIENAGWGLHDASATTWKDLIGTRDATLSGTYSWGDKYWDVQSVSGQGLARWYGMYLPFDQTWEIAIHPSASTSYGRMVAEGPDVASPVILNGHVDRVYVYGYNVDTGSLVDGLDNLGAHLHTIVHPSGGPLNYYVDGSSVWNREASGNSTGTMYGYFANRSDYGRGLDAKYYCVRLYDRALTAAEIAANYAVDAQRFGIGGNL